MAHILVVDDLSEIRHVLRITLESRGYTVSEAENGCEALLHLNENQVDLMITDITTPDMDGIELIRKVRRGKPEVRIVAISGGGIYVRQTNAGSIVERIGVDALIPKPLALRNVIFTVEKLLPPSS